MAIRRTAVALAAVLIASALPVDAQQPAIDPDSARAGVRTVLRAFYFNLAHHDWEALAADILSAKVVASRAAPEAFVAAAKVAADSPSVIGPTPAADAPPECSTTAATRIDHASIRLDGDWAEVSVPRCGSALGADEFRLIRFERRWRIVYSDLIQESGAVQLASPAK